MAEEDASSPLPTGSPCDEIDPAELFESGFDIGAEGDHVNDRGSGSEFDSECEDQVDLFSSENDFSDDFPSLELESFAYGVTPPRDIRRQKERLRKEKEKVSNVIKGQFSRELRSNPSEKAELDRRKKRGSALLTTERAFRRRTKRASVDAISFNVIADTAKSLEIPSIKIESTSRFMSLDCVCEDSTESFVIEDHATNTGSIPVRQTVVRGHPRASRSESDPRSFSARNYVNPRCPEARMDFYRTFSLLIKLGSLAHKQQESQKQQIHSSSVESQSSEENKKWKVELSQALWLELQAWHANRSMSEQDQYLMAARASVNEVLDEVINFKVKIEGKNSHVIEDGNDINCQSETVTLNGSSQEESTEFIEFTHNTECATNLTNGEQLTLSDGSDTLDGSESNDLRSLKTTLHLDLSKTNETISTQNEGSKEFARDIQEGSWCQLKAAIEQVIELFDKVERVENLYPNRQSLGEQNPKYKSEEFSRKFETMCLWLNVTRELYHKLHLIAKFVGVDVVETETWKDWIEVGLGKLDDVFPVSDLSWNRDCEAGSLSSDDYYDDDVDDDDDDVIDENDDDIYDRDVNESDENKVAVQTSTPTSPRRTVSYESQSSSLSRPSRTSSNLSGIALSSTTRYRPFVDLSIKKMGLIKLGKRVGGILDSTMMKARRTLAPPLTCSACVFDPCQRQDTSVEQRKMSVNYLETLLNEQNEEVSQSPCSCHPHHAVCPGLWKNLEDHIWNEEFEKGGLPSFRSLYLFLCRIPLDIIHESLRLRLQHRPKGEPSPLSVRQLLRECKDVLLAGVLVKDYYLDLVDGIANTEDLSKENPESDIEGFEQDLQSLLQVYFEYLHNVIHLVQRLPQASKGQKNILEEEWNFVKKHCRHIRGGEVEGGTRFCVMASGLLQSTGDFLESELDQNCSDLHNNTDQSDDLRRKVLEACRGFKNLFNEARERASKALGFAKKLTSDLENAAKFSIDVPVYELLTRLEASGHVQVVARHTAGLMMFVPRTMAKKTCQIIHLLNSCCVQEELGDQVVSDGLGYLLIMSSHDVVSGSETPVSWTGKTVTVNPTMDTAIGLADIQVGGMILVVQNSKELDVQRKLFLESMSLSVSIVKPRTSSHQAIAEALEELQDACMSLREGIIRAIERVDENLDLDSMFDMDEGEKAIVYQTYTETMHLCYNFAFEYLKEVARLVIGAMKDTLGHSMLAFARQWMTFVTSKCERGRGTRPRWANQGLDFLTVACDPKMLTFISETKFQELKKQINACICHVIGSAESCSGLTSPAYRSQSPACSSPVFGRGGSASSGLSRAISWPVGKQPKSPGDLSDVDEAHGTRRQMSDPVFKQQFQSLAADVKTNAASNGEGESGEEVDKESGKHKDSFVAEPGTPWLEKVRHSLRKMETKRNEFLYKKHVIGRMSNRRRDIVKELASISNRKVPFKWQRGNKIGEGQFGKVYACVNLDTGEMMAVKQIKFQPNDHGEIRDLADEIKNFEGIRHESLVRYYGVELHRDEMFIFMEYCADGTISDVAKLGLPETMIRKYTYQILVAVSVLHEKGIVHRDIKGANIFVSSDGYIKLGDFGSSIKLKNPFQTNYGEISNMRGTVAYMAPEVITLDKGAGYGRAADIWSIGCVVVEMATGKPPWPDCDNNYVIMFKVGEGATPDIPENLSEEGQDFLLCCFLHDSYSRPTAIDLMDDPFVKCC
ncbi:mitogen-activated protein kinase kinase kinase 4-like isoform X1 [Montipora foliosa]|uniref:mitogen-activated protein kinase kinase kinase 4-like isoform X1 n=1 Tax=Montipora foliosa TaxID=591990 RepID=UPI0035F199FA